MKFNILQFLPKKAKVKTTKEIRKNLFKGKSLSERSRQLNVPLKNMSRYKNGTRSIPIRIFNELVKLSKTKISKLQNKINIKIGKRGAYLNIGPFIKIDEKWIYVSELIKGDGHIPSSFYWINFVNQDKELIDYVKKFFLSLGLKKERFCILKRNNTIFLTIRASLMAYVLNKVLEVPIGKKERIRINDFVIKSKNFGIAAVRGAFDAEGSVTFTGSRRISITSNCKEWLIQLQKILINLRIESKISKESYKGKKPLYRILIHHYNNLKKFQNTIKPLHKKRKEKLKEILNNYTKNPQRMFHKRMLLSIKQGNFRKKNIAENIKQNLILTGNNLSWLRKNKFIIPYEKICTNKGCFYKYKITKKGEEYLKNSLSFFD